MNCYELFVILNSYIISEIVMGHQAFYARQRYKKMLWCQPLHDSWRNATNMYMGSYEWFVISNSYIISEIVVRHQAFYARQRFKNMLWCQLPRSGWSVDRAGLGAKATYPA